MCTVLIEGGAVALGPVTVLKFGSSLLGDEEGFARVVWEIKAEMQRGRRVVAVVSAVKGTTDRLLACASELSTRPAPRLLTLLLRTGEDASVALLGIALIQEGLNAHVLTADDFGLRTTGPLHDADPAGLDLARLVSCLRAHDVVVVPGFVGRDARGHPTLLGRGGSDLTALFVGDLLGAEETRLVKDVDGVFPADPRELNAPGPCLPTATWSEVERIGNGVVQPKALQYAEQADLTFRVAAVGGAGTLVGGCSGAGEGGS